MAKRGGEKIPPHTLVVSRQTLREGLRVPRSGVVTLGEDYRRNETFHLEGAKDEALHSSATDRGQTLSKSDTFVSLNPNPTSLATLKKKNRNAAQLKNYAEPGFCFHVALTLTLTAVITHWLITSHHISTSTAG